MGIARSPARRGVGPVEPLLRRPLAKLPATLSQRKEMLRSYRITQKTVAKRAGCGQSLVAHVLGGSRASGEKAQRVLTVIDGLLHEAQVRLARRNGRLAKI